jgi:hypothetical protein
MLGQKNSGNYYMRNHAKINKYKCLEHKWINKLHKCDKCDTRNQLMNVDINTDKNKKKINYHV